MQPLSDNPSEGRHLGIGGSDARKILDGDWLSLYEEKVGIRQPEDLSDVFPVQLGRWTEPFHLNWFAKRAGLTVRTCAGVIQHADVPWMFAHLDGWATDPTTGYGTFAEFKHTNGQATLREQAHKYMPQLGHYAMVTGRMDCWFSIIAGNTEPEFAKIEFDRAYLDNLFEMEKAFWWHVEQRVPPEAPPTGVIPAVIKAGSLNKIAGTRDYDWTDRNEFNLHAGTWLANKEAAAAFEKAKEDIKALVPADAASVLGISVKVTRAKNGALTIRERAA